METTSAGWGRGFYVRAHNIPEDLRGKICCHCGRVIKWGDEADLKKVPVPFSAHQRCQDNHVLIHASLEVYQKVIAGKGKESGSDSVRPVDDESFSNNVEHSRDFLLSSWYKRVWILFLNLFNGGKL